ncbi:hypothetical protein, partial [Pseudovibrio sp. SPO723]|uniref:hypothetical protein n=1 Tax=Nesiotobacter zosterae TaxID=392721 RepID=UPI0029C11981
GAAGHDNNNQKNTLQHQTEQAIQKPPTHHARGLFAFQNKNKDNQLEHETTMCKRCNSTSIDFKALFSISTICK